MSNHTPGPWMVATSNSWRRIVTKARGLSVIEPYTCHDGHPDLKASMDDLELAARAPELLEELTTIRAEIRALLNDGGLYHTVMVPRAKLEELVGVEK